MPDWRDNADYLSYADSDPTTALSRALAYRAGLLQQADQLQSQGVIRDFSVAQRLAAVDRDIVDLRARAASCPSETSAGFGFISTMRGD